MTHDPDNARSSDTLRDVTEGIRAVLPVLAGVIPFALVLGALAAKKGITPIEVGLMSAFVFAGSAQFAAIELWATPLATGALTMTVLLINLRHIIMGVALAPHLREFSRAQKGLTVFWMADELWALALRRAGDTPLTPTFYFGLAFIFWASWVAFSVLGALAGTLIDDPVRWGFDFAFVAVFIVLVKSFWRGRRTAISWIASAAISLLVWHLVDGPWYVISGAVAGVLAALFASNSEIAHGR